MFEVCEKFKTLVEMNNSFTVMHDTMRGTGGVLVDTEGETSTQVEIRYVTIRTYKIKV